MFENLYENELAEPHFMFVWKISTKIYNIWVLAFILNKMLKLNSEYNVCEKSSFFLYFSKLTKKFIFSNFYKDTHNSDFIYFCIYIQFCTSEASREEAMKNF